MVTVPAGWPGSSLRAVCPCELGHLRLAPSAIPEKKWTKGRPRGLCTPTIKSASEKHQRWRTFWRWSAITEWLKLCCPNCLVLTVGAQREQLGLVLYVKLARIRLKLRLKLGSPSNAPKVPSYTSLIIRAHLSALKAYKNVPWNIRILTYSTRTLANFPWNL